MDLEKLESRLNDERARLGYRYSHPAARVLNVYLAARERVAISLLNTFAYALPDFRELSNEMRDDPMGCSYLPREAHSDYLN